MRSCVLILALAACKSEAPAAPAGPAPDPVTPGVAIAELKAPQQIRPPQVVLVPDEQRAPQDTDAEDLFQRAYMIRDAQPAEARKMFFQVALKGSGTTREKARNQLDAMDVVPNESTAHELYLRGYQLKDAAPQEALQFFLEARHFAPSGSPLVEKISARIERIQHP